MLGNLISFLKLETGAYIKRGRAFSKNIMNGVTKGLAGIKLSGSPNKYGLIKVNKSNIINIIKNPTISLYGSSVCLVGLAGNHPQ